MGQGTPSNSNPDPYLGHVVAGRYRLDGRLGVGAMGTVYRALDLQSGDAVALKLTSAGLSDRQRARAEREARSLSQFDHPAVVSARDHGVDRGHSFLVMELVEGNSLAGVLALEGAFDPARALQVTATLARGVAHAHERGVLHRDIKPANVILRGDGSPVLVDFGLARDALGAQSLTQTGQVLGTPGYWSPEQASGRLDEVGPQSDVYGLGATLYAMLTGRAPFQVSTISDLTRALQEDPPPPSTHRPELAPQLDALCMRCLARRPADRFPTAYALATEIGRLREAGAPTPRGARPGLLTAAAVAVVVALAAVVGAGVVLSRATPPAVPEDPLPGLRARLDSEPQAVAERLVELSALEPDRAEVWGTLALARLALGDEDSARAAASRALELNPEQRAAHYVQGEVWYRAGDLEGAEQALDRAIDGGFARARAHVLRGSCRLGRDDSTSAEADFRRALELDPDSGDAHAFLVGIAHEAGEWGDVLEHGARALELKGDGFMELSFVRSSRARAFEQLGESARGEAELDVVLAEDPEQNALRADRFFARVLQGKLSAALEDARRLEGTEQQPVTVAVLEELLAARAGLTSAEEWTQVGLQTLQQGDAELAHGDFSRALELDPASHEALKWRAMARQRMGLARAAIADLDALAAAGFTRNVWWFETRGMLCFLDGNREDAVRGLQAAHALAPDQVSVNANLGTCLAGVGRYEEALGYLERALELDPTFATALLNRGSALVELGRLDEAIAAFEHAIEVHPDAPQLQEALKAARHAKAAREQDP